VRECAMPLFSKPMKAVERLSKALGEIETSYADLISLKKTTVGGRDVWPTYRMAVSCDVLQQVGIRRVVELTEALGRDVSAESFAPVWVGARAVMEIAALMYDVTDRAQACVAKRTKEAFQDFDSHLDKVYVGFKSMEWAYSEDVVAKNILTTLQRTSKRDPAPFREALERFGAPARDFMSAYEMVSEGAHPNYVGTVESYQRADTKSGICELIDSPVQRDPELIAIPVDFAAGALLIALSAVRDWESSRDTFIALLPQYQPQPMPEPKRKPDEAIGPSGS
jgi:hypothetical protein